MVKTNYIECQECKKVCKIPKLSRKENILSCSFCGSFNVAYINKKMYDRNYDNNLKR